MSIAGNLKTMDLAELLQWLSQSQKTGSLVINNGKIEKRLFLKEGRIVSSSSTDPKEYLGHFLVSQGFINDDHLTRAVERQNVEKTLLGKILVSDGAVTEEDLQRLLRLKAEESIYDIFTWENGEFRFLQDEMPEQTFIPLSLDLTGILMEGARRVDEWKRILEVVPDLAAVPVSVVDLENSDVQSGAQRILSLIDDNRSVEEIQEKTHSTAFFVCSVLFDQVSKSRIKIVKPRIVRVEVPVPSRNPPHPSAPPPPTQAPPLGQYPPMGNPGQAWGQVNQPAPGYPPQQPPHGAPGGYPNYATGNPLPAGAPYGSTAYAQPPQGSLKDADPDQLEPSALILAASENIADRDFERAMRYLRAARSVKPDDSELQSQVRNAEDQIRGSIERTGLTSDKIPKLAVSMDELTTLNVSAQEGFILTRIDGNYNLKSILKISSMPEIDALILFDRMLKAGYISI